MDRMNQHVSSLLRILPEKVYLPKDQEFTVSLRSYFSAQESDVRPACIVCPQTSTEVALVVSHIAEANRLHGIGSLPFAIRSGGHACFAGSANISNGVTLDLRGLNSIEVIDSGSQVSIGTGASWGQVYRILDSLGLAIPGGRHSQVGVGGLTLGGKFFCRLLMTDALPVSHVYMYEYVRYAMCLSPATPMTLTRTSGT